MAINFNTAPYQDDYDENNNYVRVLFKPGYAVQARELTQLQTALQNQISAIGTHLFQEGAVVFGGRTAYEPGKYINFALNTAVDLEIGDILVGQTSFAKARVVNFENKFSALTSVWYEVLNGKNFDSSESVTVKNFNETLEKGTYTFDPTTPFNTGYIFSISPSVFYLKNHFCHIPASALFLYTELLTARLGISISENIVNFSDDETLLDPALGSSNYLAPGADRYQIALFLSSQDFDPESNDVELLVSENFVELVRVVNNNVIRKVNYTDYNNIEDTLARRTYDESGDYTVSPFSASVKSRVPFISEQTSISSVTEDDLGNVVVVLSEGKSYVRGYEFETTSPTNLILEKARDTKSVSGAVSYYDHGNYIYVDKITGDPAITDHRAVNLRAAAGNIVGNAFVYGVEYDSTVGSNNIYRLYLSNVTFLGSNTFAAVANVVNSATVPFRANVSPDKYANTLPYIVPSYNSTALIKAPAKILKTFKNPSSDTLWKGKREFTGALVGPAGNVTHSYLQVTASLGHQFIGSGGLSKTTTDSDYYVVVTSNSGTGPGVGQVLTYNRGLRVQVNSSSVLFLTFANTSPDANFGSGGGNSIKIYAKVALPNWVEKTKTLTSNTYVYTGNTDSVTVILPNTDGFELTNVIAANTVTSACADVTSYFTFFNGQRDTIYDYASVSTATVLSSAGILPGSNTVDRLTISYQYFSHTGGQLSTQSGYFSVDSYNTAISYSLIPSYTTSTGEVIRLADVLDFRPVRNSSNTCVSDVVPTIDTDLSYDYVYYLGRKDRIVALPTKNFSLIKGTSDDLPRYPAAPSDGMTLYTVDISPYTFGPKDVKLNYFDNRRFTMRDIGNIEKRVERVEYYTALSLLEKQAADARIPGSTPGIDKFKSGIVVDAFADHTTGDPQNEDYKCSVDFLNKELRPRFTSVLCNFKLESLTNLVKYNNIIALPFTSTEFLGQKLASRTRNVRPVPPSSWVGTLRLLPASDSYIDRENITFKATNYITNLTPDGVYTSVDGSLWNNWLSQIRGIDTTETGTTTFSNSNVTVKVIRNKLIDKTQATYVRSRPIKFVATGMLPDTRLHAFTKSNKGLTSVTKFTELVLANTIAWVHTEQTPVTVSQSGYSANAALVLQNRVFVEKESGASGPTANASISLTRNGVTVTSTLLSTVPSSNIITTNNFGAVAGYINIPSNFVPAGDVEIVLSDTENGKGATWAGAIYPATGVIEKYADITITTVRPLAPPPTEPPPPPITEFEDLLGVSGTVKSGITTKIPTKIDFIGLQKLKVFYDVFFGVNGYSSEFSGDETVETFKLKLPYSGTAAWKYEYKAYGLVARNDNTYDLNTSSSDSFNNYIGFVSASQDQYITINVRRKDIVNNFRILLEVEINDSLLSTKQASEVSLSYIHSKYFPTAKAPVFTTAPSGTSIAVDAITPILWMEGKTSTITSPDITLNASTGTTIGVLRYNKPDEKGFYYGVNPGNIWGRTTEFKIEWVDVPGWTGIYSIRNDDPDTYLVAPHTKVVNKATSSSTDFITYFDSYSIDLTFPSSYNPPSLGPGGTKWIKKGKIRLTVTEQGAGARSAVTAESGTITMYLPAPAAEPAPTTGPAPTPAPTPVTTVATPVNTPAPPPVTDAPTPAPTSAPLGENPDDVYQEPVTVGSFYSFSGKTRYVYSYFSPVGSRILGNYRTYYVEDEDTYIINSLQKND